MKRLFVLLCVLLGSSLVRADAPMLVATTIELLQGAPQFNNKSFDFKPESAYVLLMDNLTDSDLAFSFDSFGHAVSTLYLEGVHSVSQTGMNLPARQKVIWSFTTTQPGEFDYQLNIAGQPYLASKGRLIIQHSEQEQKILNNEKELKIKQQLEENKRKHQKIKKQLR